MTQQPGATEGPVALEGGKGDAERFGCLRLCEPGEESQLNHACGPRIYLLEPLERFVQFQQILITRFRQPVHFGQCELYALAAALFGLPVPRMIDEDASKLPGGHGEKMRPILPLNRCVQQFEEQLIDEGSRLKRMVGTLPAQVAGGDASQLLIHGRDQLVGGGFIAFAPAFKQ